MGGGRSKYADQHQRLPSKKSEIEALNVVSILGLQGVGKSTGKHARVRVRPSISHTHTHTQHPVMKQFRGLEKSGKFELPQEEVMKVKR